MWGGGRRRKGDEEEASDGEEEKAEQEGSLPLFSCRMDSARDLATMLSCLSAGGKHRDQHALCEVSGEELIVAVTGRSKTTQAQGTLKRGRFAAYECDPNGGRFGVNLTALLDCIQIFGVATTGQVALAMAYYPDLALLKLSLEEGQDFTSCELRTLDEEAIEGEDGELTMHTKAFRRYPEVCRVIIKSESLRETFQELSDLQGSASMKIRVGKESPHFQLSSAGCTGFSEIEFSRGSEAFVHFECDASSIEWTYQLRALESCMRALHFARETYFRINKMGILCVQHQIPMAGGESCFVDFILLADEDDVMEEESRDF